MPSFKDTQSMGIFKDYAKNYVWIHCILETSHQTLKVKTTFSETNCYLTTIPVEPGLLCKTLKERQNPGSTLVNSLFVIYSETEFFESVKVCLLSIDESCMKSNWISINAICQGLFQKHLNNHTNTYLFKENHGWHVHYYPANAFNLA